MAYGTLLRSLPFRPIGNFPESSSQAILVEIMSVGILCVYIYIYTLYIIIINININININIIINIIILIITYIYIYIHTYNVYTYTHMICTYKHSISCIVFFRSLPFRPIGNFP